MEDPDSLPPDMEFDVTEEIASTSKQLPAFANSTSMQENKTKQNERKRLRLESAISSINVSDLAEKLTNYNPQDQNKFGILGALADIDISTPVSNPTTTKINVPPKPKISWCPPIFTYNVNINSLVESLRAASPQCNFKIKNINKNKSKLYFADSKVHASMMDLLKSKNIQSYSFTPKDQKQTSLIIRNLFSLTEPEAIKNELDQLVPETVASVSKFRTPTSIKNNTDTGLFLVCLLPGKKFGEISHIRQLQYQSIIWEKPKKRDTFVQCRRCQGHGHIARNCNCSYRCVKCKDKHLPGECKRSKTDTSEPYCVNCEKTGHPVNWRGCPSYKKYASDRKKKMAVALENRALAQNNVSKALNTSKYSPEKTFSNLFKSVTSIPQDSTKKPQIIQDFLKLANLFFGT